MELRPSAAEAAHNRRETAAMAAEEDEQEQRDSQERERENGHVLHCLHGLGVIEHPRRRLWSRWDFWADDTLEAAAQVHAEEAQLTNERGANGIGAQCAVGLLLDRASQLLGHRQRRRAQRVVDHEELKRGHH
eukprot:scaffold65756_cov63-Phaeocystis_antarctica.AAC.2